VICGTRSWTKKRKISRSNSLASPVTSLPLIHAILESAVRVISRPVSDFANQHVKVV